MQFLVGFVAQVAAGPDDLIFFLGYEVHALGAAELLARFGQGLLVAAVPPGALES